MTTLSWGATWQNKAALNHPTEDAAIARGTDGRLYVVGGFNADWLETVQVYDTPRDQWADEPSLPRGFCCGQAVTLANGQLLLLGGGRPGSRSTRLYAPLAEPAFAQPRLKPFVSGDIRGAGIQYDVTRAENVAMAHGTTDIGNHCDDCTTEIQLPFSYTLYDRSFDIAHVSSNGQIDFGHSDSASFDYGNLPFTEASNVIFGQWADLCTNGVSLDGQQDGIFTEVTGTAPHRVFTIEWRTTLFSNGCDNPSAPVDFELQLIEGQPQFRLVYGVGNQTGDAATVGVQQESGDSYTQFLDTETSDIAPQTSLLFTLRSAAPTSAATVGPTGTPDASPSITVTNTPEPTGVPTITGTPGSGR